MAHRCSQLSLPITALLLLGAATAFADSRSDFAGFARRDSLSRRVYEVGSDQAEYSKKGRWSSRTIESTLRKLSKGKPLKVVPNGENACNGAILERRHHPGGLWSEGGGHPLYGRSWSFEEGFGTVFGIQAGMDTSELLSAFGKPHANGKGVFLYLSEPLPPDEEHGAPSRWRIGVFHEQGKVKTLVLVAEFDDC